MFFDGTMTGNIYFELFFIEIDTDEQFMNYAGAKYSYEFDSLKM